MKNRLEKADPLGCACVASWSKTVKMFIALRFDLKGILCVKTGRVFGQWL